jgi:hypothetical protein
VPLIKLTSFVDITEGRFVTGVLSREPVQLRQFGQEDKIQWSITFVEVNPDQGYSRPYTVLPVTGLALKVGIGFLAQTPLCEQDTWTYDATASPQVVRGVLDLDTDAMRNAFQPGVDLIEPYLEFQLTDADGKITPIHQIVQIFRELILDGSPSADQPNQTFYDASEMDALYVKRVGKAGEGFFMKSADGTQNVFVYLGDDGSMHYDPVNPPV